MQKGPILDWGTYNGLSKLSDAMVLGMRLTEIPPRIFSRKRVDEGYFKKYREACKGVFTTVTAHAPYYSLTSEDRKTIESVKRAMVSAMKLARIAGAEVFNVHIGSALDDRARAAELAADIVKHMLREVPDIVVTLETTYTPKLLGNLDDIRAIIEHVGEERVGISLQLDNDFIREHEVYKTADFVSASKKADEKFWYGLFERALKLSRGYFSLRFSQVVGMYLRKRFFVKKRVPLGKGFPELGPLARAIAKFILKEIYEKELPLEIHIIYTGPTQTKNRDSVELYSAIVKEVAELL